MNLDKVYCYRKMIDEQKLYLLLYIFHITLQLKLFYYPYHRIALTIKHVLMFTVVNIHETSQWLLSLLLQQLQSFYSTLEVLKLIKNVACHIKERQKMLPLYRMLSHVRKLKATTLPLKKALTLQTPSINCKSTFPYRKHHHDNDQTFFFVN